MNKLRQSFRRKKDVYVPEASRPHQWQTDEEGVRTGKCSFPVKVRPHVYINLDVEKNWQFIVCEIPLIRTVKRIHFKSQSLYILLQ